MNPHPLSHLPRTASPPYRSDGQWSQSNKRQSALRFQVCPPSPKLIFASSLVLLYFKLRLSLSQRKIYTFLFCFYFNRSRVSPTAKITSTGSIQSSHLPWVALAKISTAQSPWNLVTSTLMATKSTSIWDPMEPKGTGSILFRPHQQTSPECLIAPSTSLQRAHTGTQYLMPAVVLPQQPGRTSRAVWVLSCLMSHLSHLFGFLSKHRKEVRAIIFAPGWTFKSVKPLVSN